MLTNRLLKKNNNNNNKIATCMTSPIKNVAFIIDLISGTILILYIVNALSMTFKATFELGI